jgi:hypothetical protein
MAKPKVQMIPLAQIKNKFDVRTTLDEDRVLQLVGLYEGGVDLPPVELIQLGDDSYAYVDGRHRGAARAYLDLKDVPAIISDRSLAEDAPQLFAYALELNWGGAKPPTRDDITHTIIRMMENGAAQTVVRSYLSFIPNGSLRAYIASARSTVMKRKISKSLDAIAEGAAIEEAAKRYAVPLDSLKDVVSGKKGRWGKNRSSEVEYLTALKLYISKELASVNNGIAKKMQDLQKKVEDGEVNSKGAMEALSAWGMHLRKTSVRVEDWKARFAAIGLEQETSANKAQVA